MEWQWIAGALAVAGITLVARAHDFLRIAQARRGERSRG